MYWLPLHTDMAKFTSKSDRGRQVSLVSATVLVLGAVMPIVAGWILTVHSYDMLFLIAIVVYFTALLPLIFLPRTEEHFSWGYFETWRQFFSQGKRRLVLAYTGNGAEEAVNVIIWPIFIWELLEGNYFEVGAISSLVVAVSVVLQLSVGRFIDTKDKQKIMRWGNLFYAAGWIAKVFIATAFQIFVVSTYHNFAKIFARAPFDALMYEKAADQGHYVDEFTVLHEIAFQFGKSLMLIFALAVVPFLGITWTFVLAALASLAMNFLADQKAIQEGRHIG
jgi:MFS family permease